MNQFALNTEKLDKVLADFLSPFGATVCMGLDFSYFVEKELITYSLLITEQADKTFSSFVKSLFPNVSTDIFIWSILHELGHHMTVDEFENEDWNDYLSRTAKGMDDFEYYTHPIELAATVWAGEYIQSHEEEVTRLWEDVAAALKETYSTFK